MFKIKNLFKRGMSDEESDIFDPRSWFTNLFSNGITNSGERITNEGSLSNSNVYTCANILGGDIGKLPIQTFIKKNKSIEKVSDHPVNYLLGIRPNKYMSPYIFKELMQVHLVIWGNAYANIEWDSRGYPIALWPLNPGKTKPRLDKEGNLWYITSLPSGEQKKIPWYDVLHIKNLSKSGIEGMTPISVIREELGLQKSRSKFLSSFYANGTTTMGILKTPTAIGKEGKEKMRNEWQKLNSGMSNANRVAILDAGLDYQEIGMPLADAQFLETSKFSILEVSKIYKIPPHKLGQLDRATFSNIENQSLEYVKNTIHPIVTNWEQEINFKLFTKSEQKSYYVKFNLASELRGDSESRGKFYKTMIEIGAFCINDVLELEEMESIGDIGEKHFVSLNYTTVDMIEQYQMTKAKGGMKNDKKE